MRKELLWAGVISIIFGLIIGFGVYRVRSTISPKGGASPKPSTPSVIGQFKITIASPNDFGVVTASPVSFSGITKSKSWVIISSDEGDFISSSNDDGTFSIDADLVSGINYVNVTAVNPLGGTASESLVSVFSSAFEENVATDSSDVQKTVADKLAKAENPPKAYIGTVTDIADSTIQIKTMDSQIQQVATDKYSVSVVDDTGNSSKSVKLTDVAIGDFIIAMGYVDGNEVLDAKRILISDALTEVKISVSLNKISAVGKKSIDIIPVAGGETTTITPGKNTDIFSYLEGKTKSMTISSFKESDLVILVSDTTGSPSVTRSIINLGQ